MAVDIIARAMAAQAGGGSGGEPAEYLKTASVANNALTLVHKDGSTTVFSPDGANLPVITVALSQIVAAGQDTVTGHAYLTLSTNSEQRTILENVNNGIIKIDLSAVQSTLGLPVPYLWIKKNTVNVLQGLTLIQYSFDNSGFEYGHALTDNYIVLKEIGTGGAIYESTSSKELFISFSSINPTIMWTRIGDCETLLRAKADLINGKVPAAQLPSYVDDVIEGYFYNNQFYEDDAHTTVIEPESGKVYVDKTTNFTYRWSGSQYTKLNDVDLTNYVTKTDYASASDAGVVKVSSTYGLTLDPYTHILAGVPKDWSTYGNADNSLVVSKGTLNSVIAYSLVTKTDYPTAGTAGAIKLNPTYCAQVDNNGVLSAGDWSNYSTLNNNAFISKAVLEKALTSKGVVYSTDLTDYVKNTDYASTTAAGIIRAGANYGTQVSGQFLQGRTRTYEQYGTDSGTLFVCKGTLENVLVGKNIYSTITLTQAEFDALTEYADNTNYQII